MQRQLLVELESNKAAGFLSGLGEVGVRLDGLRELESKGTLFVSFEMTITSAIAAYVIELVKEVGAHLVVPGISVDPLRLSTEQLVGVLGF